MKLQRSVRRFWSLKMNASECLFSASGYAFQASGFFFQHPDTLLTADSIFAICYTISRLTHFDSFKSLIMSLSYVSVLLLPYVVKEEKEIRSIYILCIYTQGSGSKVKFFSIELNLEILEF